MFQSSLNFCNFLIFPKKYPNFFYDFLWNKIKLNFFKSCLNLTNFEFTFPLPPPWHILVFYIPVIYIVNLIDNYLNYCKVLKLELKTRQTSKQTNIQTNRELKNWGTSSLRRKRNSGLSGPIPQCMTNVCMFSQSSQSLPVYQNRKSLIDCL